MALWQDDQPLVLASRSSSRRAMLQAAGIPVEVCIPDLDERAVEAAAGVRPPAEAAALLAREKAKAVARLRPHRIVVGADQTLAFEDRRFDKPHDRVAARKQLMTLAGKTHYLHSAVALARDGKVLFEAVDTARLTFRQLSGSFLDRYLDAAGSAVFDSVGAYQLEKLGVHLFERINGDHFTILGLPLLKLLDFLRRNGSLAA
ncbi:MAG TPA: Maf family protein [Xanthobacteraceae bacterium]|jgi:septum formation protein|nr:Maf family protein [Xanthobacteraceae bacterium]